MAGLVPAIHDLSSCCTKNVDTRAFAAPKGLRPRRRDKPGHDEYVARACQTHVNRIGGEIEPDAGLPRQIMG